MVLSLQQTFVNIGGVLSYVTSEFGRHNADSIVCDLKASSVGKDLFDIGCLLEIYDDPVFRSVVLTIRFNNGYNLSRSFHYIDIVNNRTKNRTDEDKPTQVEYNSIW